MRVSGLGYITSQLGSHSAVKVEEPGESLKVKTGEEENFTATRLSREVLRVITMIERRDFGQTAGPWPMSNEEILQWFSRDNIPLDELIQMWIRMDQNEKTRVEIQTLKEAGDTKELERRLRQRIQFGTAGDSKLFGCL